VPVCHVDVLNDTSLRLYYNGLSHKLTNYDNDLDYFIHIYKDKY